MIHSTRHLRCRWNTKRNRTCHHWSTHAMDNVCTQLHCLFVCSMNSIEHDDFLRITLNPSMRYTIWNVVIGGTLNATSFYACLQTQAQRYLCVKSTRAAKKYVSHCVNMSITCSACCLHTICSIILE
jgi:hypothetical protein